MNSLTRPFKFPKKSWVVISIASFLYLFLGEPVNLKDDHPTAWRLLLRGEFDGIAVAVVFSMFWLVVAFAFGAFVAAILGILKQLLEREVR